MQNYLLKTLGDQRTIPMEKFGGYWRHPGDQSLGVVIIGDPEDIVIGATAEYSIADQVEHIDNQVNEYYRALRSEYLKSYLVAFEESLLRAAQSGALNGIGLCGLYADRLNFEATLAAASGAYRKEKAASA